MSEYFCKHCGQKFTSISAMTACDCRRHPSGPYKGKHAPYEGTLKQEYVCKHCGQKFNNLAALTACDCRRHPSGPYKGKHEAML